MKKYKVKIEPEALSDIQEITDWYNEQANLGKRFQNTTKNRLTVFGRILRSMLSDTMKFVA